MFKTTSDVTAPLPGCTPQRWPCVASVRLADRQGNHTVLRSLIH
mgnify:CR=1 FL=1